MKPLSGAPANSPVVVLVGNPNAGKSTVFNAMTGLNQKTGNYPGVTVERKQGHFKLPDGRSVRLFDLPGAYSLLSKSPDEEVVRQTLSGELGPDNHPDVCVVVLDASNFERNLYLALQVIDTGIPTVVALNMWDAADERGRRPDLACLAGELGVVCVPTVGHHRRGIDDLVRAIEQCLAKPAVKKQPDGSLQERLRSVSPEERYAQIEAITRRVMACDAAERTTLSDRIDSFVTHPVLGWVFFVAVMALIFQSIFTWASPFMDLVQNGVAAVAGIGAKFLPDNALGRLVLEGIVPGVGNVLVFLPQIFLLFFFIALFEDFGYMARAAFVLDRVMRKIGLNGKAFLPLLSSFACAIPGVMATRTITDPKDRLATILVAPLMSCSARLPVYALMIGAFIPAVPVLGPLDLKGATLLSMYLLSITAGLAMATLFKRTFLKGRGTPFIMELPPYRIPHMRTVLLTTWEKGKAFILNAGSVILAISVVLWFLASYPKNPEVTRQYETLRQQVAHTTPAADRETLLRGLDHQEAAEKLKNSYAGTLGRWIEPAIAPLGFDWKIGIGLVASFAAREVLVSTLAVIYNVGADADERSTDLIHALRSETNPETGKPVYTPLVAVSLMVFFVLACQCMSTVAVVRRETNGWRWPAFLVAYMTTLAWLGSFAVFQIGKAMGWGG